MNGLNNGLYNGLNNGLENGLLDGVNDGLYNGLYNETNVKISKQSYLLNTYPNAFAAYSLRKLNNNYNGAAIKVRRSNDNALKDIGFDINGNLDETSLATFVGTNSGFVNTWYDQSGNAKNVTQSTTASQPRVVNSGVIDKQNGKVAVVFDGTDDFLEASSAADWRFIHESGEYTNFGAVKCGNVTDPNASYVLWGTTLTVTIRGGYLIHDTRNGIRDRALVHVIGSAIPGNSIICINSQSDGTTPANTLISTFLYSNPNNTILANRSYLATNNSILQNNNTNASTIGTGNPNHPLVFGMSRNASSVAQAFLLGSIQEQIFYKFNQSPNRTDIQGNINRYYRIY